MFAFLIFLAPQISLADDKYGSHPGTTQQFFYGKFTKVGCQEAGSLCYIQPSTPIPSHLKCAWGVFYIDFSTPIGRGLYSTAISVKLASAEGRIDFARRANGLCYAGVVAAE